MSTINTGGPAFPNMLKSGDLAISEGGMTLRDYFAGKAMPQLLGGAPLDVEQAAKTAYLLADAMLAAREVTL